MIEELRRSSAHVFVDDLEKVRLGDDDRHHLGAVLRLRRDEPVTCSDGQGGWVPARWDGDDVAVVGAPQRTEAPGRIRTIAVAPMKGDKVELVVEKTVEIGIDQIVVLSPTAHTVVRWSPDKQDALMERYRRIARAASMQSRRLFLPRIVGPGDISDLRGMVAALGRIGWAEPGGGASVADIDTLVVGPEGGWSPGELAAADTLVDLGPSVLRAETAAIVGAALMVAHSRR